MEPSALDDIRALLAAGRVAQSRRALDALIGGAAAQGPAAPADFDALRIALQLCKLHGWDGAAAAAVAAWRRRVASGDALGAQWIEALEIHARAAPAPDALPRFFDAYAARFAGRAAAWPAWLVLLRLQSLLRVYRIRDFDAALREFGGLGLRLGRWSPCERALLVSLLGLRHVIDLSLARGIALLERSQRSIEGHPRGRDPLVVAQRVHCLLSLARAHARAGGVEAASGLVGDARALALGLRSPLLVDLVEGARGYVLRLAGDAAGSLAALRGAPRPVPQNAARRWLSSARSALLSRRLDLAESLLARARERLGAAAAGVDEAYVAYLAGAIELRRGTEDGREAAARAFRRAGALLEGAGGECRFLRAFLRLDAGWLALAEGDAGGALRAAIEVGHLARERRDLAMEAESLHLQSALLLEDVAAKEGLYEATVGRLGAIRSPELLFRVVANLYLYTHELRDAEIDLTDLHLKQVCSLRAALGEPEFRKLWDEHLSRPMLRRLRRKLFGEPRAS